MKLIMKRNSKTSLILLTTAFLITLVSCNLSEKFEKAEAEEVQFYLAQRPSQNYQLKPSGLYFYDSIPGTGIMPVTHDTVYIKYTVKFLDGTIYNSNILNNRTDTLVCPINEGWLISGLDEGITYMKTGGMATFLVPSKLAYGKAGLSPYIGGYQALVFQIRLVRVKPSLGK
jgi:FKBP-type peptidyl-prolyl cis-trans isomerase FkpA